MQWVYRLVMLAGALVVPSGCTRTPEKPPAQTRQMANANQKVAPNVIVKVDTSRSADTVRKGDTTFYHSKTVISHDSLGYVIQLPAEVGGIPYGPAQAPVAVLCDTSQGYSATILGVLRARWVRVLEGTDSVWRQDTLYNRLRNEAVQSTLDSLAACRDKAALRIAREELRDSITRKLSVAEALRELRTWPKSWGTHPATMGLHLGDDPADAGWGYTMAQRLAKWDSIACGAQQRFGSTVPLMLRARPLQMELLGRPWQCMTTAIPQWVHRLGEPTAYFQREILSAKRQKLGVITALNLLAGGCGNLPASTVKPIRAACYAPGTSVRGPAQDAYWMSPDEITLVGNASLADSLVCGSLSWTYGGNYPRSDDSLGRHFHLVPENIAALRAVGEKARLHPSTSCIQR